MGGISVTSCIWHSNISSLLQIEVIFSPPCNLWNLICLPLESPFSLLDLATLWIFGCIVLFLHLSICFDKIIWEIGPFPMQQNTFLYSIDVVQQNYKNSLFFSSLARSKYLSVFSFYLIFFCGLLKRPSPLIGRLYFFFFPLFFFFFC